jgi:hypothetical protein
MILCEGMIEGFIHNRKPVDRDDWSRLWALAQDPT